MNQVLCGGAVPVLAVGFGGFDGGHLPTSLYVYKKHLTFF
jgi:hypothetical protein